MRLFRNRYLLLSDAVILASLPLLAYWVRFEGFNWSAADTRALVLFTILVVPWKLGLFYIGGMYNRLWTQASVGDLVGIVRTVGIAAIGATFLGALVLPGSSLTEIRVPLSVLLIDALATAAVVAGPRLLAKVTRTQSRALRRASDPATLIVGAGTAGEMIAKETLANPRLGLRLIGFVDDDPVKQSLRLCGLPVLGSLQDIPALVQKQGVREMIIAIPEASGSVVRSVVRAATRAGVHTRIVPGVFEILSEKVSVSALRPVEIQDLLRREPVSTDLSPVRELLAGSTVMITGAGGSIGGELCRQIARMEPGRMLLVGHGENSIFEIQTMLREAYPDLTTVPLIADVRDAVRIAEIVRTYQPRAIFHAAAHKHVPLMEANVGEAILNNVLGTLNVVTAAVEAGTEHLVCVSTDKAVRPCSVMGLTKRVAELVVQQAAIEHGRNFVSVRFGNVLGSRGSVVPAFLRQIKAGGPVLVTHPDMRRYFMTVPEAAQLIMQAGTLGRHGEVFVLDMGEPVRIVDLATDLIRLSGLEPHEDIEVRFTGLRPGERLYEEVLIAGESVAPTSHPKVLRVSNGHLPEGILSRIEMVIEAARDRQPEAVLRMLLLSLVPEATAPSDDEEVATARAGNGHPASSANGHGANGHGANGHGAAGHSATGQSATGTQTATVSSPG